MLVWKATHLLLARGSFIRTQSGSYFLDANGKPKRLYPRVGDSEELKPILVPLKGVPADYILRNEQNEIALDRTARFTIPLSTKIEKTEQFPAVLHLLAQTPIGQRTIEELMDLKSVSGATYGPFEIVGGDRSVRYEGVESIFGDPQFAFNRWREKLNIYIRESDEKFQVQFLLGQELGVLAAELIFSLELFRESGLNHIYRGMKAASENDDPIFDFEERRVRLFQRLEYTRRTTPPWEMAEFEAEVMRHLAAINHSQATFDGSRLLALLASAHDRTRTFLVELADSQPLSSAVNVSEYFRKLEINRKLGGILAPVSDADLRETYKINPERPLSQFEEYENTQRCKTFLENGVPSIQSQTRLKKRKKPTKAELD